MFSKMLASALLTLTIAHTTPPSHVPMADADLEMGILPAHGLGFEGEHAVMTSTPCQGQKWGLGVRWRLESEAKSRKVNFLLPVHTYMESDPIYSGTKNTKSSSSSRLAKRRNTASLSWPSGASTPLTMQRWERASRRGAELEALRERISQMNAECAAALKANEAIARPSAVAQIIQQRAPDDQDQRLSSPNHRKQLLPKRRMAARPSKIPYYRRDSEVLTTLGVASASGTEIAPLGKSSCLSNNGSIASSVLAVPPGTFVRLALTVQSPRPFGRTMGAVVKVRPSVNPSPAPSEKENVEVV
ncbi:hypothetical protein B0H14DRAFT_2605962 [Mycena olivaceomarginata]|nr:hypothetical protein B0H14DRAFT_2605962 [Mycena olivaceomarginata]